MKRVLSTAVVIVSIMLSLYASAQIFVTLEDGTRIETLDVCSLGKSIAFKMACSVPEPFFAFQTYAPFTSHETEAPCSGGQAFASVLDRPPAA